ncbi:amine oxidase catalytic domain-containing protein [Ephemerocybe angulata]|uniref:Amine oxidase n=1 Tax=Ephemerocybe angulata TaxID=980116 RepID=A0A8H6HRC7_9AGAR|nr:amine oxidase catalytic domain-containing protein [Tulosesus angulatus]
MAHIRQTSGYHSLGKGPTALMALRTLQPSLHANLGASMAFSHFPPRTKTCRRCPSNLPPPASPPAKVNPWAQLTAAEIEDVQAWLSEPRQGLNLTEGWMAKASDNIVFLIEAYHPPKSTVLEYLGASAVSRNTDAPERFARVTIDHGGFEVPVTRDYVVGPLPTSSKTKLRRLTEIYHRPEIPFNARGISDLVALEEAIGKAIAPMSEAIDDLFGGTITGNPLNDSYVAGASGPWGYDGAFRRIWISWKYNAPGSWILPVNFYQYYDFSGSDPETWGILKIVYHNQTFSSTSEFVSAYKNGTLVRFPRPSPPAPEDGGSSVWTQRARTNPSNPRDLDHLPGPRSVSFGGLRFRADKKQGYVSWMGWGMDMGLALWDVRFKGERIAYQIAPQGNAAGNDPVQGLTSWLDRFFGMGFMTRDLIPNYDCPQEAVFLPSTTFHSMLGAVERERAICVFEQDVGRPLTRHFGDWPGETGAVKAYIFTVRTIATIGNGLNRILLFQFDYIFHLDGTIEVKLSATGYLQGGYHDSRQEGYGTKIREFTMGNIHDHAINFKVDLDIAGVNNTLLKTTSVIETVYPEWFDDPEWPSDAEFTSEPEAQFRTRLVKTYVESEDSEDARVKYSQNYRSSYAVVNRDERNAWGVPRGYTIHPGLSQVYNTIAKSKRLEKNAGWAAHNFATEPSSSSMWNLQLPGDPPVNFDKFFDGDNISQKDLVLWINVGTHHWPGAEDSPNTKTNVATSSFLLTPLNYFDSDPSMDSMNAITLDIDPETGSQYLCKYRLPDSATASSLKNNGPGARLSADTMEGIMNPVELRFGA